MNYFIDTFLFLKNLNNTEFIKFRIIDFFKFKFWRINKFLLVENFIFKYILEE